MFITEDGYLAVIVSRKDLIRFTLGNSDIKKTPISIIMSRMPNIVHISKEDSVYNAANLIVTRGFDSLPVVEEVGDEQFKIVGRFTKTNVTRLFVDICNGEIL